MPANQEKTAERRKERRSDGREVAERCAEDMLRGAKDSVETAGGERWQ